MRFKEDWNGMSFPERVTAIVIAILVAGLAVGVLMSKMGKESRHRMAGDINKGGHSVSNVAAEGVLPLEKLMPKFEIVTNDNSTYQIRFMAHDSTNWSLCEPVFSNEYAAASVIAVAQMELEVKYRIMKGIADDLKKAAEGIK